MSQLSRRGFFLSWLIGLLSCWLGRSQARAAAPALDSAPNNSGLTTNRASLSIPSSDGTSSTALSVTWTVRTPQSVATTACPSIPTTDGTSTSTPSFTWAVGSPPHSR